MGLSCSGVVLRGVRKAEKRRQTSRVFGDGAIERLGVVDAGILASADALVAAPFAQLRRRRRRRLERKRVLANRTKQNDCRYTQRAHDA